MEAPELNGFKTGGCRQDLECSLSAAQGVVGRTEQSSVVLSVHELPRGCFRVG